MPQDPVPYLDIVNGNAPLPSDTSVTRIARDGSGNLQASVGGAAYTTIGGGSGTVHTDATLTGDGSAGSPLSVVPQFGSDTLVKLPNSLSAQVTAVELIASLTTNTAGAEVSQWAVKTLFAGVAGTGTIMWAGGIWNTPGSAANPAFAFTTDHATGAYYAGSSQFGIACGGAVAFLFTTAGTHTASNNPYYVGTTSTEGIGFNGTTAFWIFSTTPRDIAVGNTGALATNATAGFLDIPSMAGAPSGTAAPPTGKAPICFDTTNNKLWAWNGSAWKGVVLA